MLVALFFWGVFIFVILQIPYPDTLSQANLSQLLAFFAPLCLALTFTFNIFLKNIFVSSSISIGLIFLLVLKALNSLNLVTGILTITAVALLVSYFRKAKKTNWEIRRIRGIRGIRVKTRNRV